MIVEGTNSGLSDGRGGKEPISGAKVDPRYVYYRLYTKDGALESNNPIYSDDCFISRILSKSVTPPHTVASLKTHLCWIEGIEAPKTCDLYLSLSEKTSVEDSTRLRLRGKEPGPGVSEFEPLALVVDLSTTEKRSSAANTIDSKKLPKWQIEQRYIYYRVYNEKGEIALKTSFDETDFSLGRLNVFSIPPPHTGASLKTGLVNAEGVVDYDAQLFEDEEGVATLKDSDPITLVSDACPGTIEQAPLAFVYGPKKKTSDAQPQDPVSSFSMKFKAILTHNHAQYDSAWHSVTTGEIFKTDGVSRNENFKGLGTYDCYEAISSSGKRAFLLKEHVTPC